MLQLIVVFILLLGNKGYIYFCNCKEWPRGISNFLTPVIERMLTHDLCRIYGDPSSERNYVTKRGPFTQISLTKPENQTIIRVRV